MPALKTIKNTSGVPQSIVFKGQQFVLERYDEQTYEALIADLFLDKCGPIVVDTTDNMGDTYAPDFKRDTVWVANVTGDPDCPAEVEKTHVDKDTRRWKRSMVTNPNTVARALSREIRGGQRQYTAKDGGLVNETVPARVIEIPPYRRRPLPTHQAEWFLNRDASSESPGAAIKSTAPGDFEPEQSWSVDRLRAYLQYLEPSAGARGILGPSEDDLAKQVKEKKMGSTEAKELIRQTKQMLLKRLYFKVANPLYRKPTRIEFEEYLTGKSAAQLEQSEIDALLEKADKQAASTAVVQSRQGRTAPA
jgi:hypothetical protein